MTEAEYVALLEACRDWIGMEPQSMEDATKVLELRYKIVSAINSAPEQPK